MTAARKAKPAPQSWSGSSHPHYFNGMHPRTLETFETLTHIRAKQYLHGCVTSIRLIRAVPSCRTESLFVAWSLLGTADGQISVLYDLSGAKNTWPLVKAYRRIHAALRAESDKRHA